MAAVGADRGHNFHREFGAWATGSNIATEAEFVARRAARTALLRFSKIWTGNAWWWKKVCAYGNISFDIYPTTREVEEYMCAPLGDWCG